MEQEKKEIIAKLYALRAGLSVMAQHYDVVEAEAAHIKEMFYEIKRRSFDDNMDEFEWLHTVVDEWAAYRNWSDNHPLYAKREIIKEEQEKKQKYEKSIAAAKEDCNIKRHEVAFFQDAVKRSTERAEDAKKHLEISIRCFKDAKKRYHITHLGVFFSWISVLCLFLPLAAEEFPSHFEQFGDIDWEQLAGLVFVFGGLLGGFLKYAAGEEGWFYMGLGHFPDYKREIDERNKTLAEAKMHLTEYKAKLAEAEENLARANTYYADLEKKKAAYFSRLEQEKLAALEKNQAIINRLEFEIEEEKKILPVLVQRFNEVCKAVWAEFGSFLDERDWSNVDLIIFNYETGRALDMRDALMQVDNERRNERLVKAVQHASQSISASIICNFAELRLTIGNKLDGLESSISKFSNQVSTIAEKSAKQSQAISNQLDRIKNENIRQLELLRSENVRQLEKIAQTSSAQQALLAKANTSSDELAASVERIRMIENDRYYGIR